MIEVQFLKNKNNLLTGFKITGHAMYKNFGSDIVCAAVSSAAYMTVNTIVDVINAAAYVNINESGEMYVSIKDNLNKCQDILIGFNIHIKSLAKQYPKNIICN